MQDATAPARDDAPASAAGHGGDSGAVASGPRLAVADDDEGATILGVLPWLGVPVLLAAALAAAGRRLPGEVLPVVAFLPLVVLVYLLALRVPSRRRAVAIGLPGWLATALLLAYIADEPPTGTLRTVAVAIAATVACTVALAVVGSRDRRAGALATAAGIALVFSQGLDGWQTYLAVGNPFGWLADPVEERVLVSRLILQAAPWAYPALKLGLAAMVAVALQRPGQRSPWTVPLVLLVCYAGLSPAMFSSANLLGS